MAVLMFFIGLIVGVMAGIILSKKAIKNDFFFGKQKSLDEIAEAEETKVKDLEVNLEKQKRIYEARKRQHNILEELDKLK